MKFTKKGIYIGLFAILYLIVAFSSFWHACAFFGLANNSWMSIILAFAFEVGQAAVLFSLLTSQKDRSRVMPWVLMTMFTLVQVIGNVFSSYKYLITNSVENLRYFKEPIFIWTDLPDAQTTVIITYIVGAILPVCALLLTSMITNYLTDNEEEQNSNTGILGDYSILQMENQGLREQNEKLTEKIKNLQETEIGKIDNEIGPKQPIVVNSKEDIDEIYNNENKVDPEIHDAVEKIDFMNDLVEDKKENSEEKSNKLKESHFINL